MFEFKKILGFTMLVFVFTLMILFGEAFLNAFGEKNEEDFLDISVYEKTQIKEVTLLQLAENILKKKGEEEKLKKEDVLNKIEKLKAISRNNTEIEPILEIEEEKYNAAVDINYMYIPKSFVSNVGTGKKTFNGVLNGKKFKMFIKKITLEFYEKRNDVRGKMKNKTIKLFDPNRMEEDELFAIFIHELAHYIDLYFLERIDGEDISNEFYNLSWYSTIVMNPGLEQKDFVSGYAMTNKYEDFAESLAYYIFHNDDFVVKLQDSKVLEKKYYFIANAIFGGRSFIGTDFSQGNTIKSYYRDITKIDFSKKNFLQYVENSI